MSAEDTTPGADVANASDGRQRGHLRFDRRFAAIGVDRLQRSSGTSDRTRFQELNRLLTQLAASPDGAPIIQAFARDLIDVEELASAGMARVRSIFAAHCRGLLANAARIEVEVPMASTAPEVTPPAVTHAAARETEPTDIIGHILGPRASSLELIAKPIWPTALEDLIPRMDVKDTTKRRYSTSLRALRSKAQAFRLSEEDFEVLADLSEQQWRTLEAFRTRGTSVAELAQLAVMQPVVRQQFLRDRRIRIGVDLTDALRSISPVQWRALQAAGDRPIGARHFEALDRLLPGQRDQLRNAVHHLRPDALVEDLVRISDRDWSLLAQAWGNSNADWNHVRRAMAAVLTTLFHADAWHPIRRHVIDAMPLLPEVERVPDISPGALWRILQHLPEYARKFPLCLVVTGLRIGEYERLDPSYLHHDTYTIDVPGSKTAASSETISVAPDCWQFVVQAVPSPFRYGWMRRLFREACIAAGVHGVTLHDLRHCHGQWALASGAEEHEVQAQLRHTSIAMTRRYVKTLRKQRAAEAAARHLLDAKPHE